MVFVQIQLVVHGCFDEILVYGSPQGHEIADILLVHDFSAAFWMP